VTQRVGTSWAEGTDYAFLPALFKAVAIFGLVFIVIVAAAIAAVSKRPIPILTLDGDGFETPILKLPWAAVRSVSVTKCFGLISVLCISTTDDKALPDM
jgi:hypothetical protein